MAPTPPSKSCHRRAQAADGSLSAAAVPLRLEVPQGSERTRGAQPRRTGLGLLCLTAAVMVSGVAFVSGRPSGKPAGLQVREEQRSSRVAMQYNRFKGNQRARKAFNTPPPQVQNLKDQYIVLFIRSSKIKRWCPLNIISGSDAIKNLKSFTDNDFAKALGGDKLADWQMARAIGMTLYKQQDEVKKQAKKMHPELNYAKEFEFGFKEIMDNAKFNKNPSDLMINANVTVLPPEEELRNLLDDAGDAVANAGDTFTKASDNLKGFLGGGQK